MTPDEAREQASGALTPGRRAQLAAVAARYRIKHPWLPPATRAQQDADFDAAEAEAERRRWGI